MKKKYVETLQMNISNSYCEKRKQTCIFKQHNLFKAALFTRLFRHIIKPGKPEHRRNRLYSQKGNRVYFHSNTIFSVT